MGPSWVLSAPDGPHVGPINLAIRVVTMAETVSFDSDFGSRNSDTITTVAFSNMDHGPEEDLYVESVSSEISVEEAFLKKFARYTCACKPTYDQAAQVANGWAAVQLPGIVAWKSSPQNDLPQRAMAYCTECHNFWHVACILHSGSQYEVALVAELLLMKLGGYLVRTYLWHNCHNDNQEWLKNNYAMTAINYTNHQLLFLILILDPCTSI